MREPVALPMHGPANWGKTKIGQYMLISPEGRSIISDPKKLHNVLTGAADWLARLAK